MPRAPWATPDQETFLFARLDDYKSAQKKSCYTHFWPTLYEDWEKEFPTHEQVLPGQDPNNLTEGDRQILQEAIQERRNVSYNLKPLLNALVTPDPSNSRPGTGGNAISALAQHNKHRPNSRKNYLLHAPEFLTRLKFTPNCAMKTKLSLWQWRGAMRKT